MDTPRYEFDSLANFIGKTSLDTIYAKYYGIISVGQVGLTRSNEKSKLKVGLWTEYYHSGQIKSQGEYRIAIYTNCCSNGPCWNYYGYKTGKWTYYYENGQIESTGTYIVNVEKMNTSCKGGDRAPHHRISKEWTFFNEDGSKKKLDKSLKKKLEELDWSGW